MTTPAGSEARPQRTRDWWIAVLFIVGSALFAMGAVPSYATAVGLRAAALTFFAGSLFFTSAAFLQYREAVDVVSAADGAGRDGVRRRLAVWAPNDGGWLSGAVQLAGTLWFNWSTANAVRDNLDAATADQRVWRPDALGSIAFLVASGIAWRQASRDADPVHPRPRAWWIGAINMLGSIAFGVSAVAAYVVPATGDVRNAELANLGTFVGAICFLVGAVLLLPRADSSPPPSTGHP